jgi:phosphoglycolate phosphatase-like HAD superfamily hydrolase
MLRSADWLYGRYPMVLPFAKRCRDGLNSRLKFASSTRDEVKHAKPDPDLFVTAAERLKTPIEAAIVVGDSIWDTLAAARCRAFAVGLLSGGYGAEELRQSGAIRVFEDPADLLLHIDEVGVRS